MGKGRAHHVAAKSLELGAVVAVNELLGVDADAQRFGDRLLFGFAATELARGSACQNLRLATLTVNVEMRVVSWLRRHGFLNDDSSEPPTPPPGIEDGHLLAFGAGLGVS